MIKRSVMLLVSLLTISCTPDTLSDIVTATAEPSTLPPEPPATLTPSTTFTPTATPTKVIPAPIIQGALPLSEVGYTLPLTIRHVTTSSATLFFELDTVAPATIFAYPPELDPQSGLRVTLEPQRSRHLVTLEGLQPSTRYKAVVAIGDTLAGFEQPPFLSETWGPVHFETTSEAEPLRIGVIGDASFGDPVTTALIEQMANANLDFVLHTGDVVDETEQNIDPFRSYAEKFYTPFAPLLTQVPVYTVIGNHDYDPDIRWRDEPFYYYAFPSTSESASRNQYYSFTHQGVRFLMLDSQVFFGQPGWDEQQAWLAEQLADPDARVTIPVFHVAPFTSSAVHPTNSLPVRDVWVPLFEQANVPLVLSGHFHQYERLQRNGLTYVVASGGSSVLYASEERLPESVVLRRQSHYVLLEVGSDAIQLRAITLEGDTIDSASIPLP